MSENNQRTVLGKKLNVVSIGVSTFADDLRKQNVDVVELDWSPPAGGDLEMIKLLKKLGI